MRRGYDYVDGDQFATAVAASAFAIHSLEEYQKKLRKGSEIALGSVRTRKDERSLPIETDYNRHALKLPLGGHLARVIGLHPLQGLYLLRNKSKRATQRNTEMQKPKQMLGRKLRWPKLRKGMKGCSLIFLLGSMKRKCKRNFNWKRKRVSWSSEGRETCNITEASWPG
ncbi:uncharacterized protein [Coffea arabica]|uniref:Uncharacterized protein isoform X2 n=1 Tax=Coffea arabica TaxID=13443 RepID=A0A6P6XES6_COFAR|nr:uncharacterized protein LOC113741932 isoform X2 [Coffea arabica]